MNNVNMTQLLAEMQSMVSNAQGVHANAKPENGTEDFKALLQDSIAKVSDIQNQASNLAERFEMGDKNVSITDVMVNLQKANISFQAMTQVRNRLVSAYQEIMNMQI